MGKPEYLAPQIKRKTFLAVVEGTGGYQAYQYFDDFTEAKEWVSIRQESLDKTVFSRARVERGGAILWEYPEQPKQNFRPEFIDRLPTVY